MLIELHCEQFKQKRIDFHEGLNVVLGDEKATNSIGKSSLLMVLDFAFGGNSLLEHNNDIVLELGDHDYCFIFKFEEELSIFKRSTATPKLVHLCDENFEELKPLSIETYRSFLKSAYNLDTLDSSFRSLVSLYSRVWGKENLDVKLPLHSHKQQKMADCIRNLIVLYGMFEEIDSLTREVKELGSQKSTLNDAFKKKFIPKISKTQYNRNLEAVSEINAEIEDIKENLAQYAVNLSEIVDREVSELKAQKDSLLFEKSKVSARLKRIQNDLANSKHIKSRLFRRLIEFFPTANVEKIVEVEEFHSKIAKILKSELEESKEILSDQLEEINSAISILDNSIDQAFSNVDNPSAIVDRVHDLADRYSTANREMQFFDRDHEVSSGLKSAKDSLKVERGRISKLISDIINNRLKKLVSEVYGGDRQSPELTIFDNNYNYSAIEDTGTGKAYSNLILMDLAVLQTTILPFIIHDTVLFKNIENNAVANLVNLYAQIPKQLFISIDEIHKYGEAAAGILSRKSVVRLSDKNQLYVKDWRA